MSGSAMRRAQSADSTALPPGKRSREAWRQFISTSVDGLCRRLEAQILDQLGVEVAIDSGPLGGRDLLARSTAFRRFTEGGLSIDDARSRGRDLVSAYMRGLRLHLADPASGASCPACHTQRRVRAYAGGKLLPDTRVEQQTDQGTVERDAKRHPKRERLATGT